ncbi:MAG TPA: molybdopterin-guanine dinucleotide biosynthesis protein B [Gammaproteobacteria bacterium]|nr:molybdopterin-guanine dinucleotide biosynthesis protein B [Gammaproteobacteria bacterium]
MKTTPLLGFAAWSGAGKTTLLKALLPLLRAQNLSIAMIKHAHHEFDIDVPGKDSYELRKAGANQMLVCSSRRWALMVEAATEREPKLADMLRHLPRENADLILVEGLKNEPMDKIEIHRPALNKPLLCADDPHIIAVASDTPLTLPRGLPLLPLNEPAVIADFILHRFKLGKHAMKTASKSS